MPILLGSLIVFALVILAWPIAAIIRKHYDRPLDITPAQRKLRRMLRIAAILDLVFLSAMAMYFSSAEQSLKLLDPKYNFDHTSHSVRGMAGDARHDRVRLLLH